MPYLESLKFVMARLSSTRINNMQTDLSRQFIMTEAVF